MALSEAPKRMGILRSSGRSAARALSFPNSLMVVAAAAAGLQRDGVSVAVTYHNARSPATRTRPRGRYQCHFEAAHRVAWVSLSSFSAPDRERERIPHARARPGRRLRRYRVDSIVPRPRFCADTHPNGKVMTKAAGPFHRAASYPALILKERATEPSRDRACRAFFYRALTIPTSCRSRVADLASVSRSP